MFPHFHRFAVPLFAGAAALATLVSLVLPFAPSGARAEPTASADVQSWGPDGQTQSDSSVTVRWDNTGNAPENAVARDAAQLVPHTAGKTYADISEKVRNGYAGLYGADNGRGGLAVTVSQTENLVNQAVTVSFTGSGGGGSLGSADSTWFEVFQCWGAPGADGAPDPTAMAPDPDTCQVGVGGADLGSNLPNFGSAAGDRLAAGGDLGTGFRPVPFRGVDGTIVPSRDNNALFSRVTTNEFSQFFVQAGGSGSRSFEMQTGAEAPGLGCGYRDDAPSTSTCWLVVVPMSSVYSGGGSSGTGLFSTNPSGVAPSLWAQRLQVKLTFQDVAPKCPSGQAQTLSSGSELMSAAMSSWIPGICDAAGVALGFSQLSDFQARQQLTGGSAKLAFGSKAVAGAGIVHSAVGLTGVVVGVSMDYQPCGRGEQATDSVVERCGYPDRETAQAEIDKNGEPVTELRLNARLIAKLLTQTYSGWGTLLGSSVSARAPWFLEQPSGLFADKEFLALNPALKYQINDVSSKDVYRLNVENLRSDAANRLWTWLAAEPDSKAFLDGCADPYGVVINPFFSTRSYSECAADSSTLSADAAVKIESTHSPVGFDQTRAPSYPPADTAFPQVLWYQQDEFAVTSDVVWGRATLVDLFPPVASMPAAAKMTFQAAPITARFCKNDRYDCLSNNANGEWKGIVGRQDVGARKILSITSSADAARFQVPTARLCDGTGLQCVGADEGSLAAAATSFLPDAATGVSSPPATSDYSAGAYPLAMLVYGVVNTKGLPQEQANSIASALEYIAGAGQTPGLKSGMLLPGYAPLPATLVAQASAAVQLLRNPPAATPQAPNAGSAAVVPAGPKSGVVPQAVTVPAAVVAPAGAAATQPPTAAAGGTTGATEVGFPQLGIVGGLGAALAAGALSPFFGRRKRIAE